MDIFHEPLYKRRKRLTDLLAQIGIVAGVLLLAAVAFIAARKFLGTAGRILGFAAAFALAYFGYKLFMTFSKEFELTYYNGEMDVDQILSQTQRKRLITVDVRSFDDFGILDATAKERLSQRHFDRQVDTRSFQKDAVVYYAAMKHKKQGFVLLVFEPDRVILEDIQKRLGGRYSYNPARKQ